MTGQSLHVAIIMDGNGRWAQARRRPRTDGHRAGARAVRRTVEAALREGVSTLTLYAFSSDNWKRPAAETGALMTLFGAFLRKERERCGREGIRISVIGRRDRLPAPLVAEIETTEAATAGAGRLHLRIAVDYSARHSIQSGQVGPDVDLLIRTGGDQRLSDFLLWECAYAELMFIPAWWPDFTAGELHTALQEFNHRQRRFGGLAPAA
jgi:undecaprenyl diphosphate synthase